MRRGTMMGTEVGEAVEGMAEVAAGMEGAEVVGMVGEAEAEEVLVGLGHGGEKSEELVAVSLRLLVCIKISKALWLWRGSKILACFLLSNTSVCCTKDIA